MEKKFDDRDAIREALQERKIPIRAVGYILEEAHRTGAFNSKFFGIIVTFRKGKWRLVTDE